jgi:uncharacterized protein (DUF1697 family)
MTTYLALLRGINVGGHKKVAMSDLRDLLSKLGFDDAHSLLQSGNLVFRGKASADARLERLLEGEVEKRLGLQTAFFVRTAQEWETIVAKNPFPENAERDPAHLLVIFLKEAVGTGKVMELQSAITGPEIVRGDGRQVYIVYPAGIGTSRLTNTLIEKKLGTQGTGRNWNTVLKLGALAALP